MPGVQRRHYSNSASVGIINETLNNTDSTTNVTLSTGVPTSWPGTPCSAALNLGQSDEEVVLVTTITGSAMTISRGFNGTATRAHTAGATITHVQIAQDFDEANLHTSSSSGVHGITGAVVGTTDSQTLSGKTLTSPSVADFTNAQHDHSAANKGGAIPQSSVSGLVTALSAKAADSAVVHSAGNETVAGTKTFSGTVDAVTLKKAGSNVWAQDRVIISDFSGTTNASSYLDITGLAFTPGYVQVTLSAPNGGPNQGVPTVTNILTNGFRIRFLAFQGTSASVPISGYYIASKD